MAEKPRVQQAADNSQSEKFCAGNKRSRIALRESRARRLGRHLSATGRSSQPFPGNLQRGRRRVRRIVFIIKMAAGSSIFRFIRGHPNDVRGLRYQPRTRPSGFDPGRATAAAADGSLASYLYIRSSRLRSAHTSHRLQFLTPAAKWPVFKNCIQIEVLWIPVSRGLEGSAALQLAQGVDGWKAYCLLIKNIPKASSDCSLNIVTRPALDIRLEFVSLQNYVRD